MIGYVWIDTEGRASRRRRIACRRVIAVLTCLALLVVSCRKRGGAPLPDDGEAAAPAYGLSVLVRFLPNEEIEDRFNRNLPERGIVPVEVTVMNHESIPLYLHSPNRLSASESFTGFELVTGVGTHLPAHPFEALPLITGSEKSIDYKSPGLFDITIGVIIPVIGIYYLYKEGRYGRYFKPLFENSVYPALPSGGFQPITLEPGEKRTGCLYFVLPDGENPYIPMDVRMEGVDETETISAPGEPWESVYTLVTRPSLIDLPAGDDKPYFDVSGDQFFLQSVFPRIEAVESPSDGGFKPVWNRRFFALHASEPDSRRRRLIAGRVSEFFGDDADGEFPQLAKLSSKSTVITDASESGACAACLVSFKSSSKLYLLRWQGGIEQVGRESFRRPGRKVFLYGEYVIAITSDDFCHLLTRDSLHKRRSFKLGKSIKDAMILGDRLYAFGEKNLYTYSLTDDELLKRIYEHVVPKATRKTVGHLGTDIVLLHRGYRGLPDTLIVLDPATAEERVRVPLPARVNAAAADGDNILLNIEGGAIADLRRDAAGDSLRVEVVAFLSLAAEALVGDSDNFMALLAGGIAVQGSLDQLIPVMPAELEIAVPFALSAMPPQQTDN